ncbi:AI-2E family transporter [Corynebacterium anserum]|uniref:AI-2E family transporter n=1 Tax=Corynebacterium anserum TaxID=2684406 RepID=A0A7G7YPC2_9CORY|nr:AI-2E family transporter [Corynebacterium anserum]MBC2681954.1 AI-2E family transporter [Corynebacterium anserum]QNH96342.1 AI-2E family transporter [Corynebacterium anserum]
MNSSTNGRASRDNNEGRDFADFLAGSRRMDPKNMLPLPDSADSDRTAPVIPEGITEDPETKVVSQEPTDTSTQDITDEALQQQEIEGSDLSLSKVTPAQKRLIEKKAKKAKKSGDSVADAYSEQTLNPEQRDRAEVIGSSVRWFAGWCLRFLIMALAAYVLFNVIGKLWAGILPVLLSLIVCSVLWPVVRFLRKMKIPNGVAVLLTILGFFAVIGGIFALIAPPAVDQSRELVNQANDGIRTIQDWLAGPPLNLEETQLNDALSQATSWLQKQSGNIASEVAAGASATLSALVTLLIMLVLTFFFLKDGENFLPLIRRITGRRVGWHLTEVLTRMWNTLGGFVRTQAIVSFIDAFFIGIGLIILNVPLAGALAVLTFFAGFIPMIGAITAGTLSVLIALVAVDFQTAVIVLILIIAVQQIEGNILQPVLQSRAMDVHPVIILLAVTLGGTLFGIIGAFLAVPVAAMIAVALRYMGDLTDLSTGEKTTTDINFATKAGTLTGAQNEQAAKRWQELRQQMKQDAEKLNFSNLLNPLRGNDKSSGSHK